LNNINIFVFNFLTTALCVLDHSRTTHLTSETGTQLLWISVKF